MESDSEKFIVELPLAIHTFPLVVTFQAQFAPSATPGEAWSKVGWNQCLNGATFKNVGKQVSWNLTPPFQHHWINYRHYATRVYLDEWVNDKRMSFQVMERAGQSPLRLVLLKRQRIDQLTASEINLTELPDAKAYLDALSKIPVSERKGTLVLPELKSAQPGQPVAVTFAPNSVWKETLE